MADIPPASYDLGHSGASPTPPIPGRNSLPPAHNPQEIPMNYIEAKPSHDRKAAEINLLSPLTLRCAIASPCRPCANIPRRKASSMTGISCISAAAQLAARLSQWSRRCRHPRGRISPGDLERCAYRVRRPHRPLLESQGAVPGSRSPMPAARRAAMCHGGRPALDRERRRRGRDSPSALPFNAHFRRRSSSVKPASTGSWQVSRPRRGARSKRRFVGILSNQSSSLVVRRSAASI